VSLLEALAVVAAGFWAGTINTIVGSGSLVTFPTLVAVGFPPITATVSNTVGLVPGNVSGSIGYRRELSGQRSRLLRLGSASVVGAVVGAALLVTLGEGVFETVVPILVLFGCALVALQPLLKRWMGGSHPHVDGGVLTWLLVLATGVYGGYFAAAQGVLLTAILGLALADGLQRINALKNVLVTCVNIVAATVYVIVAPVDWGAVGLIAAGSLLGGIAGAKIGRSLPPMLLRGVIVTVGVVAVIFLF
jgi:hypothetical protein